MNTIQTLFTNETAGFILVHSVMTHADGENVSDAGGSSIHTMPW